MALFKQKAENPTAATEYEIASLGARRPALERHLVDATAAVDRSVAELRTALLQYAGGAGEPQTDDRAEAAQPAFQAIPIDAGQPAQPASIVG